MKASTIFTLLASIVPALAAPAAGNGHVRRSLRQRGHNLDGLASASAVFPTGAFPTGISPSGVLPPAPFPQPTGIFPTGVPPPPQPFPTGVLPPPGAVPTGIFGDLPTCPVDGVVVCNGATQFGLCNFGHVFFLDVADGTACVDGKIVGTGIFAAPTPTPTS